MSSNRRKEIYGRVHVGHQETFYSLIEEFDDVVWSETSLRAYANEDWMDFKTGIVGRNYERNRKFIERLKGIAEITEMDE